MRQTARLTLALIFSFFSACSTQSPKTATTTTTDLGIVQIEDRETRHYRLIDGKECRIRFTALAEDNVLVEALVLSVDGRGKSSILARPVKKTRFGQEVSLPIQSESILLTPQRM